MPGPWWGSTARRQRTRLRVECGPFWGLTASARSQHGDPASAMAGPVLIFTVRSVARHCLMRMTGLHPPSGKPDVVATGGPNYSAMARSVAPIALPMGSPENGKRRVTGVPWNASSTALRYSLPPNPTTSE